MNKILTFLIAGIVVAMTLLAADPEVKNTPVVPRSAVEATAYNATTWNSNTNVATKDAIRDELESMRTTLSGTAANWTAVGSTNSSLTGEARTHNLVATNEVSVGDLTINSDGSISVGTNTLTLSASGSQLAEVANNGTNKFHILRDGGAAAGAEWVDYWGVSDQGRRFISIVNDSTESFNKAGFYSELFDEANIDNVAEVTVTPTSSYVLLSANNTPTFSFSTLSVEASSLFFTLNPSSVEKTALEPTSADGATPYRLDTAISHTSGNLADVKNNGTNKFSVDYLGAALLSGQTNRLTVDTGVLMLDGQPIGGNVTQTINYTNIINFHGKTTFYTNVYVTNGYTIYIDGIDVRKKEIGGACSDETTALTTGTAKLTFRMPYKMSLTAVRANLSTAQTGGSIFTVDINEGGSTILSTKLTVDNSEKTSTTAATPAVISDTTLADDAEITIDIDQVGDGTAKGLKIWLIGNEVP